MAVDHIPRCVYNFIFWFFFSFLVVKPLVHAAGHTCRTGGIIAARLICRPQQQRFCRAQTSTAPPHGCQLPTGLSRTSPAPELAQLPDDHAPPFSRNYLYHTPHVGKKRYGKNCPSNALCARHTYAPCSKYVVLELNWGVQGESPK